MHGNGVIAFVEQHTVASYTKPEQSFELAAERFDVAFAGLGVAVQGPKDLQGATLLNPPDLGWHVRAKTDSLQLAIGRPGLAPW
jgi:hypothetical protein